jgi:hypothetical protein
MKNPHMTGKGAWAKVFKARRIGDSADIVAIKYTLFHSPVMGGHETACLKAQGQFRGEKDNMVAMEFHTGVTLLK